MTTDTTKPPLSPGKFILESFHEKDWGAKVLEAKEERDRRAREYRKLGFKVRVSGGDNPLGGSRVWFLKAEHPEFTGCAAYSAEDYSRIKPLANS